MIKNVVVTHVEIEHLNSVSFEGCGVKYQSGLRKCEFNIFFKKKHHCDLELMEIIPYAYVPCIKNMFQDFSFTYSCTFT